MSDEKILNEVNDMLSYLEDCLEEMRSKEREFVEDIADQVSRDGWISEKQYKYLLNLYDLY